MVVNFSMLMDRGKVDVNIQLHKKEQGQYTALLHN